MPDRLRRALLFMPGDDRRKIEKGAGLAVDSVIMDLEDGVAFSQKAAGREMILDALQTVDFGTTERLVRINPVSDVPGEKDLPPSPSEAFGRGAGGEGLWQDDLAVTIAGKPDGYVIPKVESAEQVQRVDAILTQAEADHGWEANSIRLIPIIESAWAIINLNAIASSSPRLSALAFGAEDLAGDIGAIRTPDGWEVFYGRSAVVLHAKAYGLQAIDTPFVDLVADESQLMSEAEQAHYMGYTGKLAIHPRHIAAIQRVFTPSREAIIHARDLIAAHDQHQAAGTGVFAYEGRMVDMPMIRAAQTTLSRARAAGIDIESLSKE